MGFFRLNRHRTVEILAVLLVLTLTLTIWPKLAALLTIYILYKFTVELPLKNYGVLTRFILVFLSIASLNAILGFLAWTVNIPLGYQKVLLIYSLLAIGLVLFRAKRPQVKMPQVWINHDEIFALIVGLAIFCLATLPVLGNHKIVNVTRVIESGGDNNSHIELIQNIDKHAGYVQETYLSREQAIEAKQVPYPQGWHLNLNLIKSSLEGAFGSFTLDTFLYYYHLATAVGLSLLAYFFVMVALSLHHGSKRLSKLAAYSSVGLVTGLIFLGPLFGLFVIGFQTHIAALALLLAELFLLLNLRGVKESADRRYILLLAVILAAAMPYFYLPLWPIALGAIAVFMIEVLGFSSLSTVARQWKQLAIVLALSLLGLGQIIMQLPYLGGGSSALNETGFILEPNNLLLGILLAGSLIYVIYQYGNERLRLVGQISGLTAIFILLVLLYQIATAGEPRYYYYKATYTFILLTAILLSVGLSQALDSVVKTLAKSRLMFLTLTIAFIFISLSLAWLESSKYFRNYWQRDAYGMSEELADAVITIVKQERQNAHRTIAIGSCNREQDIKAMRLARALSANGHTAQQRVIVAQAVSPKAINTFFFIKKYLAEEGNLAVISTDRGLQNRLTEYIGPENSLKIRFVDLDYSRQEKKNTSCPNLLR